MDRAFFYAGSQPGTCLSKGSHEDQLGRGDQLTRLMQLGKAEWVSHSNRQNPAVGKGGGAGKVSNSPESCSWEGWQSGRTLKTVVSVAALPPLF